MNIFKKLFGGQKTTEEVRETKEKDFDMVKYDGVRALRMHQFDLAAKFLEHALQLNGLYHSGPDALSLVEIKGRHSRNENIGKRTCNIHDMFCSIA